MSVLRNLLIAVIALSSLTFIAFFGRLPAFRNTPIGFIHRLLIIHIPSSLRRLDVALTNGRITSGSCRLAHHLMHDKHPLVIIFFLGLITISAALFLPATWSLLPWYHKLLIPILLPQPYLFTYLSAKRNNQTTITASNHAAQMRHYPYDRILYYPGLTCRTCQFLKPARSKHCSICKTCVARMDHHCIWVNNCVGRGNYRWFLSLLLSTSILLAYAAYLAYIIISPRAEAYYRRHESFYRYPGSHNPSTWSTWFDIELHYFTTYASIYLELGGVRTSAVGLLALLTWPLPLSLLGYHIYLIWAGMTTNESGKWADWRDDMADGVVFLGHRKEDTFERAGSEEEPRTTWPLESRHVLVRTLNGEAPSNLPSRLKEVCDEEGFEQVWGLGKVENVYDLGFWDNFKEATR
ncbi:zf-DHHC-domain-containing protein [Sporormia fimetaria CBS 119925]|uniref:Palmitoyltransferase n=1 Tax=Sporormia fimetaria CBS 119925 TaxID=1340428 RepID=A0A6A6V7K1_9PLEO|nr:zf-DHHC-domain-containing protein [Sporormia fimetaria CBS 119925]